MRGIEGHISHIESGLSAFRGLLAEVCAGVHHVTSVQSLAVYKIRLTDATIIKAFVLDPQINWVDL
jgi:hypothetical protein